MENTQVLSTEIPAWMQDVLKLKTINNQRSAIIENTVNYYSENPAERRCVSESSNNYGACYYSGITAGKSEVEGCAVGRMVSEAARFAMDSGTITIASNVEVVKRLPYYITFLGIDFLRAMQKLHDDADNWNLSDGLTEKGEMIAQFIRETFVHHN